MLCRRCGAELPAGAATCPHCQAPVLPPDMPSGSLPPGTSPRLVSPGIQPLAQSQQPAGSYSPPPAGHWPQPTQVGQPYPPAGEQFSPPAPSIPPATSTGWPAWSGPGGPAQPPPPTRPLLGPLFGPTPHPGVILVHTNGVQRRFFSRLQPTTAGSAWFGMLAGAIVSLVTTLLSATLCSLLLGGILDQAFADTAAALKILTGSASSQNISFYSNPLVLFDYAQRSSFILKLGLSLSGIAGNLSASITPPITLLLLIPAIGLTFGGYFAASTDYTGRRLFSIARGASISLPYALLALLLSFITSVNLFSTATASSSTQITLAPDPLSVFLNSLLWGLAFGALGGSLRARALPAATTGPLNRRNLRLRAAWQGTRLSLSTLFIICLAVVLALYLLAQLGGPALHSEGSLLPITSPGTSPCRISLQQPTTAPAPSTSSINSGASGPVWFLVDSPPLAVWVMTISLGAPLQLSGNGLAASLNTTIGLIGADCGPQSTGDLFYLLLLPPAIAFFLGGRRAARLAYDATLEQAAGTGLLMAGMLALGMVVLGFLASITISIPTTGINLGPSLIASFIATLLYGAIFGVSGAIIGRPHSLPQPAPIAYAAWPTEPGAAPMGQTPQPPSVSMAVSSVRPGPQHMTPANMPASGMLPGSSPTYNTPTQLSGPLDLYHAPTLTSGGITPPQAPPPSPGGADIWHAPTQAPGSGSLPNAPTQPGSGSPPETPQPPEPSGH